MVNGTVAVLIPTYNRREYLQIAIDSVIDQTYKNFHIYIVNDGGETVSVDVPDDTRLTIVDKPHEGLAKTFNLLLDLWNYGGEDFAYWLGDDDVLIPNCFETMVGNIGNYDVLYANLIYSHNLKTRKIDISKYTEDFFATFNDNINMGTALMTRRVLDLPRIDERFRTGMEDGVWIYNLWMNGAKFGHIPQVLKVYRIHQDNNSGNLVKHKYYEEDSKLLVDVLSEIRLKGKL